ncbi:MAG: class I SAM-dependent methyltransferase [Candidatus Magnetoovum sp. WYHC-5]|nr:class I SAM-dependent methyltransferase [Candidatus Magnetoovum sp. WYHC-5]
MLSQNGHYYKGKEKIFIPVIEAVLNSRKRSFRLIDVGCGDGYLLRLLYKILKKDKRFDIDSIELVGIDRYDGYTECFNPALDGNEKIRFHVDDLFNVDSIYGAQYFDFVISVEVLEHVVETDVFIKKLKHIMKPSGRLMLTTPNLASYHGRFSLLFGFTPLVTEVSNECGSFGKGFLNKFYSGNSTETVFHVRVFTYRALLEFLPYHRFNILSVRGLDYKVPWFWKKLPSLSPILFLVCEHSATV